MEVLLLAGKCGLGIIGVSVVLMAAVKILNSVFPVHEDGGKPEK